MADVAVLHPQSFGEQEMLAELRTVLEARQKMGSIASAIAEFSTYAVDIASRRDQQERAAVIAAHLRMEAAHLKSEQDGRSIMRFAAVAFSLVFVVIAALITALRYWT